MDYSKLSDIEINGRVLHAITNGKAIRLQQASVASGETDYCKNPADAWPIIEKHGITLAFDGSDWWATSDAHWVDGCEWQIEGEINRKPFRAAMICYLKMQESE